MLLVFANVAKGEVVATIVLVFITVQLLASLIVTL